MLAATRALRTWAWLLEQLPNLAGELDHLLAAARDLHHEAPVDMKCKRLLLDWRVRAPYKW
jgi:hypothetical protein